MNAPLGPSEGNAIRQTYLVFPRWTQPLWTWWTGRALPGEQPLWKPGPWGYLIGTLAAFAGGMALTAFALATWWPLAVAGWLITVGATRTLVSTICHQCVHYRFTGKQRLDMQIADALAFVTFTKAAPIYRLEHTLQHHRGDVFTTARDPSAQFLTTCGLAPGRTSGPQAARLLVNLVSPVFHARFLWSRIRGNLIDVGFWRRLVTGAAWIAALAALARADALGEFALIYGVPVILLYHVSVMLEFASEHAWLVPRAPDSPASWGRFCGAPVPQRGIAAWLAWWIAMIGYHLVVRVAVLPADLPQHDFHHRFPATKLWTHAAHARTACLDRSDVRLVELWGLHRALGHVLRGLEELRHAG
ncbi:MAG TPA: fatty acid desaturase [Kofleriaceae bacterium]